MRKIETKVLDLIDAFEGSLPVSQLSDMRELAEAGEPGVALENLCTQLCEHDVFVSPECKHAIIGVAKAMRLAESTWQMLDQDDE